MNAWLSESAARTDSQAEGREFESRLPLQPICNVYWPPPRAAVVIAEQVQPANETFVPAGEAGPARVAAAAAIAAVIVIGAAVTLILMRRRQ